MAIAPLSLVLVLDLPTPSADCQIHFLGLSKAIHRESVNNGNERKLTLTHARMICPQVRFNVSTF